MPFDDAVLEQLRTGTGDQLQQRAKAAVVGPTTSPDEAAKTLHNAIDMGMGYGGFTYGNLDPKTFNRQVEGEKSATIIGEDEALQRYVANNDFAAHVSSDDWPALSKVSTRLQEFVDDSKGIFKSALAGAKEFYPD